MAQRLRLSELPPPRRLAPGRWPLHVLRVWGAQFGDGVDGLHPTRTPLSMRFTAFWLFATGKDGISGLSSKRVLEIGAYQTAWAMLHRLRSVFVRPGRELLTGTVQVDVTYIGGVEPGLAGGRVKDKKVLNGIAVEVREPKGLGRCRISPLADASTQSLHGNVRDHVKLGSTIITDGWPAYQGLAHLGYVHDRPSQGVAHARGDAPNT